MSTAPFPAPRTVLVTGAAAAGPRDRAGAGRGGWQVAVHYRGSRDEAEQTVADCAALRAIRRSSQADLGTKPPRAPAAAGVVARFRHGRRGGATAPRCSSTTTAASFSYALMERTCAQQHRRAHPAGAGAARHLAARGAQGAVVNLLDQKLWNPNPDFLSYTLSKAALEAATHDAGAGAGAALRVVGVAPGLTLTSHMLDARQVRAAAQAVAAGPLLHAGDVAPRCASRWRTLDHRHHAAGRRRPAPDEIRARFLADVSTTTSTNRPWPNPRHPDPHPQGLRFDANLGILDHEKTAPQPIRSTPN
jgi:hypothetical protein